MNFNRDNITIRCETYLELRDLDRYSEARVQKSKDVNSNDEGAHCEKSVVWKAQARDNWESKKMEYRIQGPMEIFQVGGANIYLREERG